MSLIADRFEIQDVMSNYAAGVDERDLDLYASVFTEDVEVTGFAPDVFRGRNAWVAHVTTALERFGPTQLLLGPVRASIDGDTARCRTDVQALHFLKEPEGQTLILWATYETEMMRTAHGWKIHRHRLIPRGTRQS